jgi:SAM-dependent methyltransferase
MRKCSGEKIAVVYNQAGADYVAYADGDPKRLFSLEGQHAYADRHVWSLLEMKFRDLRATGATSITVLDAGCGPGTWLRRLVARARLLGFSSITARGCDVAQVQVCAARRNARDLYGLLGLDLTFEVGNLEGRLPEADASVDITLCLYRVLSHLPVTSLPKVATEIARVTKGHFIATVRSTGSISTVFIDSIDRARHFELDHRLDRCEIEFCDGRHMTLRFHLFAVSELLRGFAGQFEVEDLCGIDIFHSRFSPDHRWNPVSSEFDPQFSNLLAQLEARYARNPCFMERATHLMLVAHTRRVARTGPGAITG